MIAFALGCGTGAIVALGSLIGISHALMRADCSLADDPTEKE